MEKIVFTNGCFDIVHPGHIDLLRRARGFGTKLIVGINSDRSVSQIKGPGRPVVDEDARRDVLLGIKWVDEVVIFDEPTPAALIAELQPDVLVKGGDWKPHEIIGADVVLAKGGEVHSLPLLDGYSSSAVIEKLKTTADSPNAKPARDPLNSLDEHLAVMDTVSVSCRGSIDACAQILVDAVKSGSKVLICGNGGSAADAQHIAAEFVGRYETERRALPAIALTTDTSALTALANDYSFERIFARQVEALASAGDVLIAISTSGTSPNVIAAVMEARGKGCKIVGMTGEQGKKLASLSDACLIVPSRRTARIQEAHITVAHIWCEIIDTALLEARN
ncbi:MAG: SIS domain-containing protein [Pyrinomonadaceae bacterium]|nr:SIS domain-containing protein [Pyrinomonadaceae bacterium]